MPPLHESSTPLSESGRTSGDSHNSSSAFSRNTSTTSSQASSLLPTIKCVLVGDSAVGKTSLINSYSRGDERVNFGPYTPTTFDNYAVSVTVENKPIKVQLCDTSGQDEFSKLRSVWYSEADVFIACYNVVDQASFDNVTTKWVEEINLCCPNIPIILAGLQTDRKSEKSQSVSAELANAMVERIPCCVGFVDCSSVECKERVKDVFDLAIFAALDHQGFVKKRRGLSSFRCKKYKCKSEMWNFDKTSESPELVNVTEPVYSSHINSRKGKSYSLKSILSCFCGDK